MLQPWSFFIQDGGRDISLFQVGLAASEVTIGLQNFLIIDERVHLRTLARGILQR